MVGLLKQLISTPSFSKEEEQTATIIERLLKQASLGEGFSPIETGLEWLKSSAALLL